MHNQEGKINKIKLGDIFSNVELLKNYFQAKSESEVKSKIKRKTKKGFVYLLADGLGLYKIGYTQNSVQSRFNSLKVGNSNISIVAYFESKNAKLEEKQLHEEFGHKRVAGEWFKLTKKDVARFKKHKC